MFNNICCWISTFTKEKMSKLLPPLVITPMCCKSKDILQRESASFWIPRPQHINLTSVSSLRVHNVCFMCSLWVWKGHILNDTHCRGHGGRGEIHKRWFTGWFSLTYAHFLLSSSWCKNMFPLTAAHLCFSIIHRLTVLFSCMHVAVIY